jgi:hypothetical protein
MIAHKEVNDGRGGRMRILTSAVDEAVLPCQERYDLLLDDPLI